MNSDLVYKFQDWDSKYGKEILIKRSIYLSSFNKFNDPFDSDIRVNYEDLSTEEIDKVIGRIVDAKHPGLSSFKRKVKLEHYKRVSDVGDKEQLKENYDKVVRPANEREIGIFSLSQNKDHILLWSHYADSHKGYCIGFEKSLFEKLSRHYTLKKMLAEFEEVHYRDTYPDLNPADNDPKMHLYPLLIKSNVWQYEDEIRFLVRGIVNRSIDISKKAIREVTLGLNISDENREEILDIIRAELSHINVFQSVKADRNFALNFEHIY